MNKSYRKLKRLNRRIGCYRTLHMYAVVSKSFLWKRLTDLLYERKQLVRDLIKGEAPHSILPDNNSYFVKGCDCHVVTTLPDGTRILGGVDDCPVHGFGEDRWP